MSSMMMMISSVTFTDMKYDDLQQRCLDLNGAYAVSRKASDMYGIDTAKTKDKGGSTIECSPYIVRVTDTTSIETDIQRPQTIISGEIHGDERVGPSASLFVAELLVWSASCMIRKDDDSCHRLKSIGVTSYDDRIWLAFLATRRDTYIMPTANCLGYIMDRRDDNGIDPNRDFSYSREDGRCFLTTTAKIFGKLMSETLTQIVITFHGGMEAIGYEWGSKNHLRPDDQSPDDHCNSMIAEAMKTYAGHFHDVKDYPVGRINSLVYPVDGGMEDWLYAAGWDKGVLKNCNSDVPSEITNGIQNRAIVYLVETSDAKHPSDASLGGPYNPLTNKSPNNGHVPRNLRVALTAIDAVQPYVCFSKIETKYVTATKSLDVGLTWSVGGAFHVENTFVELVKAPMNYIEKEKENNFYYYLELLDSYVTTNGERNLRDGNRFRRRLTPKTIPSYSESGNGKWASILSNQNETYFKATVKLTTTNMNNDKAAIVLQPGEYWLIAWAEADKEWGGSGQGFPKDKQPQSYLANARTNPDWVSSNNGRQVKGRKLWPSEHVAILVEKGNSFSFNIKLMLILLTSIDIITVQSYVLKCAWWSRSNHTDKDSYNFQNTQQNSTSTVSDIDIINQEESVDHTIHVIDANPTTSSTSTEKVFFVSTFSYLKAGLMFMFIFFLIIVIRRSRNSNSSTSNVFVM